MQFSNISDFELAKLFVHAKKEKIEKLLCIKHLDTYAASKILTDFIKSNNDDFCNNYSNKYTLLFDDVFFYMSVNELQKSKNRGVKLDGVSSFREPKVMYVS